MGTGILVCGLNGSGKSSVGEVLAEKLGFHFIDDTNLFSSKKATNNIYAASRFREAAETFLLREIRAHKKTCLCGSKKKLWKRDHQYAVLLNVPKDVRLKQIRERYFQKFGKRMLPGGDLYKQE